MLPPSISIGVDIGGTKVAAGVVDERGNILERLTEPTPSHSPKAVENAILRVVGELRSRHRVEAVGIGAAGWVDNEQAVVRFSRTRLPGHLFSPIQEFLSYPPIV